MRPVSKNSSTNHRVRKIGTLSLSHSNKHFSLPLYGKVHTAVRVAKIFLSKGVTRNIELRREEFMGQDEIMNINWFFLMIDRNERNGAPELQKTPILYSI